MLVFDQLSTAAALSAAAYKSLDVAATRHVHHLLQVTFKSLRTGAAAAAGRKLLFLFRVCVEWLSKLNAGQLPA